MYDETVVFKKYHRVSRWLEVSFQPIAWIEIQAHLVIYCSQAEDRYAQPVAGQGPVKMAKEEMFDLAGVGLDDALEFFLLGERYSIQCWNADVERGVVHKEVDSPIIGQGELLVQPGEPSFAIPAVMVAGFMGIEKEEASGLNILPRTNKNRFHQDHVPETSETFHSGHCGCL